MKKTILRTGAMLVTLSIPVVMSGSVFAATTTNNCSIYGTGTDSYNACIASNNNQTYVTCVNNVYTTYTTTQTSTSGNANSGNNSSSGNVSSGSAVNSSGTTVQIGATCTPPATTPTTPTTPGTGGGSTTTTTTTTPAAPTPTTPAATTTVTVKPAAASLPETGSAMPTVIAVSGLATLVGVLTLRKLGVAMLGRVSK